jgi:hypothetical protein
MPPKRCRIICIGGPIAIPLRRDPGWLPSLPLAIPRGSVPDPVSTRIGTTSQSRPPTLRGGTRPRGISGSNGPHHGHRTARRAERRKDPLVGRERDPRFRGPAPTAGLPSAGQHLRCRGPTRGGGWGGARSTPIRPSRRLRRSGRPARGRSRSRRRSRHRRAPRGGHQVGTEQRLQHRRGDAAGRPSGADPLGTSRIFRSRSAHGTAGGRGRGRHSPEPMIPRAEQRSRAGAADQD